MFEAARLKLTLWYVLIILLISGSFSGLFYYRATQLIWRQHDRIQDRIEKEDFFAPPSPQGIIHKRMQRIFEEDFETAKRDLLHQLVLINGMIIFVTGSSAYFLAGKTLEPIKTAMDEQKRFVGDAAHELKTPITALKTSLEVNLMDKKLGLKARKILLENLDDLEGLESLTESLLKLAKVDGYKLAKRPVLARDMVNKAMRLVKPLATKKKIRIQLSTPKSKLAIWGDEDALTELVVILLDNAIKFSPDKSRVNLQIKQVGKNILVSVSDRGVGIDKHHVPHIFDRFYRVESSRTKWGTNGFGLGLSVAEKIVREHQGKIEVESEPNKGSTFKIWLPADKS